MASFPASILSVLDLRSLSVPRSSAGLTTMHSIPTPIGVCKAKKGAAFINLGENGLSIALTQMLYQGPPVQASILRLLKRSPSWHTATHKKITAFKIMKILYLLSGVPLWSRRLCCFAFLIEKFYLQQGTSLQRL